MSEKCRNDNNSDNPLTTRRTDGVKQWPEVVLRTFSAPDQGLVRQSSHPIRLHIINGMQNSKRPMSERI